MTTFQRRQWHPHSSTLAWKTPWMEEPGRLQSMGSRRVRHNWATSFSLFIFLHWRRKWQPTPVLLPGESQGQGSLLGCRLWGRTELDTTEATEQQQQHDNFQAVNTGNQTEHSVCVPQRGHRETESLRGKEHTSKTEPNKHNPSLCSEGSCFYLAWVEGGKYTHTASFLTLVETYRFAF